MNTLSATRNRHRSRVLVISGIAGSMLLAGCGGGGGSTSQGGQAAGGSGQSFAGKTLTVMIPAPTTNVSAANTFNNDVAQAFHEATGATLKYDTYASASTELTKIETSVVSHSGPDVMNLGTTLVATAYATHAFSVLSPADWAKIGGQSAFFHQQLTMGGPDPAHYIGVPVDAIPFAMAYNTSLFQKAGITSPPKTWSDYVADAQKVNDPSQGVYGTAIDPGDSYDPWKDYWTFARQDGGNFVSKDHKTSLLDSPKVVKAVQFWFDWDTKFHIVDPSSLTWKSANLIDAFAAGKIGEVPMQTISDVPTYQAGAIGKNFAFAPMPSIPYGESSQPAGAQPAQTIVSGQDDVIASYAPKDLALQYLKVVTSLKTQQQQWQLLKEVPVTTAAANAVEPTDPTVLKPFIDAMGNAAPTAFVGAWGTVESAVASATSKLATRLATTQQLPPSYVQSVLHSVNSQVQQQL